MKINNKLFLITATLGLMAAGSATAFAGHSNYVYVENQTSQSVMATESWQSGGQHMHFYYGSKTNSASPLTIDIGPGCTLSFRQDANTGFTTGHAGAFNISGVGEFTFVQNGTPLNETAIMHYHTMYSTANQQGNSNNGANLKWNRLNYGELQGTANLQGTYLVLWNTDNQNTMTTGNELNCNDDTHMYIYLRTPQSPNASMTSSPMGKLSTMLSSFKL